MYRPNIGIYTCSFKCKRLLSLENLFIKIFNVPSKLLRCSLPPGKKKLISASIMRDHLKPLDTIVL